MIVIRKIPGNNGAYDSKKFDDLIWNWRCLNAGKPLLHRSERLRSLRVFFGDGELFTHTTVTTGSVR